MPKKILKLFRKSLRPIVQGDSCPSEFCPMTQFSIETIVQWKFCPSRLLQEKSLLKLILFIFDPHRLSIE